MQMPHVAKRPSKSNTSEIYTAVYTALKAHDNAGILRPSRQEYHSPYYNFISLPPPPPLSLSLSLSLCISLSVYPSKTLQTLSRAEWRGSCTVLIIRWNSPNTRWQFWRVHVMSARAHFHSDNKRSFHLVHHLQSEEFWN